MLIDISSATLRKMVKLSERKEALLAQIQELDREMVRLQEPGKEKRPTSSPRHFAVVEHALQNRSAGS
jgi:hypothetical protein